MAGQNLPKPNRFARAAAASFGSRTDVGRVRDHNEDSLVVLPPLFAVADGMGGHEAGEVASEIAIQTITKLAPKHPDSDAFSKAVQAANLNVLKAPSQGVGKEGMGTTFTGAILEDERLLIAQVGDSRAYLLHQGQLQQLTRDHSLMADLIEIGQITPEEARVHPNRSVITRALGSEPHTLPDMYEINVSAGDRILLCSDGLSSMIEDAEIAEILRRNRNPQDCADRLVDAALEAGGLDNVTVIVVDVQGFAKQKQQKKTRKSRAFFALLIAVLAALIALAVFGGYQYINNSAYLIEENGKVSVYRGVPDTLLGMSLSSLEKTTEVEVDKLPPGVANRIKEGMQVDSLEEADRLIQSYEEEIAKADQVAAQQSAAQQAQTEQGTQGAQSDSSSPQGMSGDVQGSSSAANQPALQGGETQ